MSKWGLPSTNNPDPYDSILGLAVYDCDGKTVYGAPTEAIMLAWANRDPESDGIFIDVNTSVPAARDDSNPAVRLVVIDDRPE